MTKIDSKFTIAAVERETGLSKDVLRVWERRYAFPEPVRGESGERLYPLAQVERLCLIKRLMDQGYRPGKLMGMATAELIELAPRKPSSTSPTDAGTSAELDDLIQLVTKHDIAGYGQTLQQLLARKGLALFVQDIVAPLSNRVGAEWERGTLKVFEEHLFTELTKRVLRQAIASLPTHAQQRPYVVLTTLPGEQHMLGLLMVEALFALEGAKCIPLGAELPLTEITQAAIAHRADIVGLSFSSAFPQRQISTLLKQLRELLPASIQLWVGGSGAQSVAAVDGVTLLSSLQAAQQTMLQWRSSRRSGV